MNNKLTDGELRVIAETDHVQCGDAASMALEPQEYRKAETIRKNAETSTNCQCNNCLAASILSGESAQ